MMDRRTPQVIPPFLHDDDGTQPRWPDEDEQMSAPEFAGWTFWEVLYFAFCGKPEELADYLEASGTACEAPTPLMLHWLSYYIMKKGSRRGMPGNPRTYLQKDHEARKGARLVEQQCKSYKKHTGKKNVPDKELTRYIHEAIRILRPTLPKESGEDLSLQERIRNAHRNKRF